MLRRDEKLNIKSYNVSRHPYSAARLDRVAITEARPVKQLEQEETFLINVISK
ncbi:MAG: hypothetical protein FWD66_11010 [Paludibacter sp.]|nr:hypothetical protein [Paludibacter sp.]